MRDDVKEHLDGERPYSALDAAAREEADAWDALTRGLRVDVPGPAPAWLEGAVMAEVAAAPHGSSSRALAWLLRPSLRLSPLGAGLAAAAVLAALLLTGRGGSVPDEGPVAAPVAATTPPAEQVVYVQFVLEAPSARSVAVAGDFNAWDGSHELEDTDGDGVWTGRVPILPGVHEYMFVVDGSDWVTDPRAGRWSDDGFGHRNAVLAVAPAPPGAV
jgi:hypothetical protein